ncbi:MAG: MFS transporter [Burkholderiales bacterium]
MMKILLPVLNRAVRVKASEVAATFWSFGYFFCLLCGYYILRPVRDEMGIQGGVGNLQWLFTATFIAMLVAVPAFGWVSSRFPRRQLLPIVYLFFVANVLVFFLLLQGRIAMQLTAQAFFIWTSVFNLFVVSVFWSFMADLYSNEQAKRLFGFIAAGGSTGAIAGPSITAWLAPLVGPALLLPISAAFLLAAVLCIMQLLDWSDANPATRKEDKPADKPLGGSIFAGITLMLRSEYLLGIGLYIVLYTILSTFLYFTQAYIISGAIPDSGDRTALFAKIDLAVNALTLVGQIFVVHRLIGRFGLSFALVLLPVFAVVGFFVLGLYPTLGVLVAFQIVRRAANYAITRPAREILFTVVTREEKYKAKNFNDTVVYRGGDAVSGWLFEGLRMLGLGFSGIAFLGVPIAMLWATTGFLLGRAQERMRAAQSATRRIYDSGSFEPGPPNPAEDGSGGRPAAGDAPFSPR